MLEFSWRKKDKNNARHNPSHPVGIVSGSLDCPLSSRQCQFGVKRPLYGIQ